MRSLALIAALTLPVAAEPATIWSCAMDTAQETVRFTVEGDRLRDLRGADLLRAFGLHGQTADAAPATQESFRIVEDTADDLVAVRVFSRFEPDYVDWLHVGLVMIDKHTGRLTARTTFQKGAIGFAPLDGNGTCTTGQD